MGWTINQSKIPYMRKKSRIRETKHLSTDAYSSTDAIGRWTKNTKKPIFFLTEKITKNEKTQKCLEIRQNLQYALRPAVSNPSGSVVSTMFVGQRIPQNQIFLKNRKNHPKRKNS